MPAAGGVVGRTEGDLVLTALGVRRLALPIPFVQAGGPVNAYLIDNADGSLTLFDTGLITDEAQAALEQGFCEAGRRVEDVSRILLSHGHVDHYGLARRIQARSGAKVFLHPADWNKVLTGRSRPRMDDYLVRLGVPEALLPGIAGMYQTTEAFGERLDALKPLEEGQRFDFAHFHGQILHFPGHTPGLVCLHLSEQKILLTDDHLLARVSPNPLLEVGEKGEADKFRALVAYLVSARRLREMDLLWLAPGHGPPFQGHKATLDSLFGFYQHRQDKIARVLERAPRTAYELVGEVFGAASPLQLYLMLSELVGNLEVLEDAGRVTHDTAEWPYRFRCVPSP